MDLLGSHFPDDHAFHVLIYRVQEKGDGMIWYFYSKESKIVAKARVEELPDCGIVIGDVYVELAKGEGLAPGLTFELLMERDSGIVELKMDGSFIFLK